MSSHPPGNGSARCALLPVNEISWLLWSVWTPGMPNATPIEAAARIERILDDPLGEMSGLH